MSNAHIVTQIILAEPTMPQDLMTLSHPDAVSALREINLDRLGFTQRCTQNYQGQGIIPLQIVFSLT